MTLQQWFSATILINSEKDFDCKSLIKYAYELKNKDKGRIETNYGGWQSNDLNKSDFPISSLVDKIEKNLTTIHEIYSIKKQYLSVVDNIWININSTGSYNMPHVHPENLFSGVFYLKTPKSCGNIIFSHPSSNHVYHYDEKFIEEWTNINSGKMYQTPEPGKIIIFPSWLLHHVEPNLSQEDRISIAFNTNLKVN
jgi:uncharacterized protein (TIGR02466 family)